MKGIKQIKDYRLLKELGRGANGVVYEAVEDKSNKFVAIKSIPNDKLSNPRLMEQFKKELKTLYRLSHKNIIKIIGVEKTVNNVYLILEYCNGGTLYDYSTYYKRQFKKRLPEIIVQKIIKQIIEGLKYMHKNNIIHRDVKLENILINFDDFPNIYAENSLKSAKELYNIYDLEKDNFSIKIADLGYARDLEGGAGASTICGTPMTLAPEVINIFCNSGKDSKYNSAIDLWSLGAVLYELLMGVSPFVGNSAEDIMRKVFTGFYEIPSNISISIESIYLLNGLLQFYPNKRLNWDQIIYHPFITKDVRKFKYIKLNSSIENKDYTDKLVINSKDCSNFLWILFKASGASLPFELDELDKDTYEEIIKDVLANEMFKESDEDFSKEKNEDPMKSEAANFKKDSNNNVHEIKKNNIEKFVKNEENEKKNFVEDKNIVNNQYKVDENILQKNESNYCLFDQSIRHEFKEKILENKERPEVKFEEKLIEKNEEKIEEKKVEKIDVKIEEKIEKIIEEKIEIKYEEKVELKIEEKIEKKEEKNIPQPNELHKNLDDEYQEEIEKEKEDDQVKFNKNLEKNSEILIFDKVEKIEEIHEEVEKFYSEEISNHQISNQGEQENYNENVEQIREKLESYQIIQINSNPNNNDQKNSEENKDISEIPKEKYEEKSKIIQEEKIEMSENQQNNIYEKGQDPIDFSVKLTDSDNATYKFLLMNKTIKENDEFNNNFNSKESKKTEDSQISKESCINYYKSFSIKDSLEIYREKHIIKEQKDLEEKSIDNFNYKDEKNNLKGELIEEKKTDIIIFNQSEQKPFEAYEETQEISNNFEHIEKYNSNNEKYDDRISMEENGAHKEIPNVLLDDDEDEFDEEFKNYILVDPAFVTEIYNGYDVIDNYFN